MEAMGSEEFHRLRVGVGRPVGGLAEEYVLEPFLREEKDVITRAMERAVEACLCWLDEGIVEAMDRYNVSPGENRAP